jgi:hypothetical protein
VLQHTQITQNHLSANGQVDLDRTKEQTKDSPPRGFRVRFGNGSLELNSKSVAELETQVPMTGKSSTRRIRQACRFPTSYQTSQSTRPATLP